MDEERVVLLGTIQERQSVDNASPYVCKAGGTPAWYSKPPSEASSLSCAKCGNGLFLVAQLYAPVETDRTLYVFGCNSVACTESPGSWRVLRDQAEPVKEAPVEAEVEVVTKQVDKVKLAWGSDSDDSDWSDDEDDSKPQTPAVELVDLEALLQQRDDAMKTTAKTVKAAPAPKKAEIVKENAAVGSRNAFPALPIEVIDEPYEDYSAEHDFAHEHKLLEHYMKQEEEEKSTDIGDLRSVISNSKKKGAGAQSTGAASSTGESYEKTPAQQRHLLRFQKRISRCPLQCLRYDYGGEPLWPVVIPQNLKVPNCPGCGEERSFEMQLTPTINYFLKVDEYAAADSSSQQKPASSDGSEPKAIVPPGGMDWLSLIVYSCSASCTLSHEEFVYVVPSPTS
ncbi:hypothetical protein PR003_g13196 [Phytophthora rubi]|uniref:Programmed cell death protein 2 C-terminal domain-containing protein n=1 Tax=Phytophthora rubi TaxID=129364 RepID=A0A6A3LJU7_9STRA|nr:hypothetical protein PR002_g12741 [Phytophthora rubi]KAE9025049.1 hypothetical protein PR001_g12523 [Phytophthora rubi]KAE9335076.1 hypothetical protein PR003_g13196 [Phytophthora rubi]